MLLTGGPELATAIAADRAIGSPVFRDAFTLQADVPDDRTIPDEQKLGQIAAKPPQSWSPEIGAIARGMAAQLAPG